MGGHSLPDLPQMLFSSLVQTPTCLPIVPSSHSFHPAWYAFNDVFVDDFVTFLWFVNAVYVVTDASQAGEICQSFGVVLYVVCSCCG